MRRSARRLAPEDIETLTSVIAEYRKLAIQCSNTAFNFAQLDRDPERRRETTFQLVRDYDRAENRLIEVLKDTGLFRSLSEHAGASHPERKE